jgi:hypothetical protein
MSWFATGVGVRFTGTAGGQRIQNGFHHYIHGDEFSLSYDDHAWEGLVYAVFDQSWRLDGPLGVDVLASALASQQRFDADATVRVVAQERTFVGRCRQWLGLRWSIREGGDVPSTTQSVAAFEQGFWLNYGLAYRNVSLSGEWDPFDKKSSGAIGIVAIANW